MIPNKFQKGDRRCLALLISVVFATATSTPIHAKPRTSTAQQLATTKTPSPQRDKQLPQVVDGQLAVFVGHQGEINSVKFSPNGNYILTASDDQTARLWDA